MDLPKVKYKFGENKTRFFVGLMIGVYTIHPGIYDDYLGFSYSLPLQATFGAAPEIGVQFGRSFQISSSFHFTGKYKNDPFEFFYKIWQFNLGWNINFVDKN